MNDYAIRPATEADLDTVLYRHRMFEGMGRGDPQVLATIVARCRGQGMPAVHLHASEDGRALYAALGFETTNEMRLRLK